MPIDVIIELGALVASLAFINPVMRRIGGRR